MLAYLDTLIGFAVVMLGASLLITILTQMASALFSHRGANLRWGLETMFQNMPNCPLLKANARQVAEDVLTNHMKLATAVSPDELAAILQDLAARAGYLAIVPPGPPQPGVPAPTLAAEIIALLAVPNPSADRQIQLLTGEPNLAAVTAEVAPLLKDAVNSMRDAVGQLEAWFAATMDRVSTRFTTYARIWTIAFAVLFAAVTGMNSVTLISSLYSHGDFRQQMAGAAPQMIDLTGKVMPAGAKTPEEAVQSAMTEVYTGAAARALTDATATADAKPEGIQTEDAGKAWITAHVADAARQSAALAAFGKEIDAGSKALLEQRAKDGAEVRSI